MTREQKLRAAAIRAAEIMVDVGIGDWGVTLTRAYRTLAYTNYRKKEISFSKHFLIVATKDQLEGVTFHESAHALVGPGHGHDSHFKRKCFEISGSYEYAQANTSVGLSKYLYVCPECHGEWPGNRSHRRLFCPKCHREREEIILLRPRERMIEVTPW